MRPVSCTRVLTRLGQELRAKLSMTRYESMQPGFIGGIPGRIEIGVVLILGILLSGADRIPRLARSVGESMGEFRWGRETIEDELQDED